MEHALPRHTAGAPRTWSLCMTSENHGTVGPAGCTFSHAPEKHERVLVVEVVAAGSPPAPGVDLTGLLRITIDGTVIPLATSFTPAVASTVLTDERIEQIWDVTETADAETLKEVRLRFARAIAREVAAQAGQVAVPEGWKLVPVEPTLDMVTHGFESAPDEFFSPGEDWDTYAAMTGCQKSAHRAKLCYAAMLAAAPSPAKESK